MGKTTAALFITFALLSTAGGATAQSTLGNYIQSLATGAESLSAVDIQGLLNPPQVSTLKTTLANAISAIRNAQNGCGAYRPLTYGSVAQAEEKWQLEKLLDSPYEIGAAMLVAERVNILQGYLSAEFNYAHHAVYEHRFPYPDCVDRIRIPVTNLAQQWERHALALSRIHSHLAKFKGVPQVTSALPPLLGEKDFAVVAEVIRRLINGGDEGKEIVRRQLKDANADTRFKTAFALWELVIPYWNAVELKGDMVALLQDPDANVRKEVVGFLYAMRDTTQQDKVAKLLSDPDTSVRGNALGYLGQAKAVKYKKQIEALLKHPDELTRKQAKAALDKIK